MISRSGVYRLFGIVLIFILLMLIYLNFSDNLQLVQPVRNAAYDMWHAHVAGDFGYDALREDIKSALLVNEQSPPPSLEPLAGKLQPIVTVAFCSSVRDQGKDMPEWLTHHYYNIGINHFYIMDDGSNPPLSDFDKDGYYGIPPDAMTFNHYGPEWRAQQGRQTQEHLNEECNLRWGAKYDWIAYVDVDEFIGLLTEATLQDILAPFTTDPAVGAVALHWWMHTSNGHLTRQPSVRKAFTQCMSDRVDVPETEVVGDNAVVKSLVKPSLYVGNITPHHFATLNGSITVVENGEFIASFWKWPVVRDRVVLHHYALKSKEEYEEKLARGNQGNIYRGWEFWDHIEAGPVEPCEDMLRWEM